jgi:hypothetical protein
MSKAMKARLRNEEELFWREEWMAGRTQTNDLIAPTPV